MEAETEKEANEWVASIKLHIIYGNELAEVNTNGRLSTKRSSISPRPSINDAAVAENKRGYYLVSFVLISDIIYYSSVKSTPQVTTPTTPTADGASSPKSTETKDEGSSSPAKNTKENKSAAAVASDDDDGFQVLDFHACLGKFQESVMSFIPVITESDKRNQFLSDIKVNYSEAGNSLVTSIREGDIGKRGEEWTVTALILAYLVIVGVHPMLEWVVGGLIKISGNFYMIAGVTLLLNAFWVLKDNTSLFMYPKSENNIITTGNILIECV